MKPVTKPFFRLTAADVMNPLVIAVPRQMSVQGAAHLLTQNRISGAPVVSDEGRCIGVVSSTDFVCLAENAAKAQVRIDWSSYCSDWAVNNAGRSDEPLTVEGLMTANPVTTRAAAPIGDLAQKMLDAHIHRVIVVNEAEQPIGIVSTTDILAAIARAARIEASETSPPTLVAG